MQSLADMVREAGVIGAGGAGFPTHVKLGAKAALVVANGAECEPLLNSDQRVMERYAPEVVDGLSRIMREVGAERGVLGVKAKYKPAVAALRAAIAGRADLDLFELGNFYPAGDEQVLLTEINGKVVPEAGLPLHVGAVVSNVLTMAQVSRAAHGIPVTEREVTLVGEVEEPQVVTCPIGTPVRELLALAKPRLPADRLAAIDGGPMMGKVVPLDSFVNKTTSGLIFLPAEHDLIQIRQLPLAAIMRRSVAACCQCRECTELCSRFLQGHRIEPHLMMRGLWDLEARPTQPAFFAAFLCSQCGLCELACPMMLSPRRAFAEVARRLRAAGEQNPLRRAPEQPHEWRNLRHMSKDRLTRRYGLSIYESHTLPLRALPRPPSHVSLSLTQASGAPAKPVVAPGARVTRGQLVAAIPEGKLGANLHASIDGVVSAVDDRRIEIRAMTSPALGLLELNSIARGILLHDLMVKKAAIKVLQSHTICPGKYLVLIGGEVGPVEASMREGLHYGGAAVVDSLLIPNISPEIFPAMLGATHDIEIDSVVIVETFSVAAAITLADLALKRVRVALLDMRLAQGLGGKAYFILTGPLNAAEEAARWVREHAEPGMLTNVEVIPAPTPEIADSLLGRIS